MSDYLGGDGTRMQMGWQVCSDAGSPVHATAYNTGEPAGNGVWEESPSRSRMRLSTGLTGNGRGVHLTNTYMGRIMEAESGQILLIEVISIPNSRLFLFPSRRGQLGQPGSP